MTGWHDHELDAEREPRRGVLARAIRHVWPWGGPCERSRYRTCELWGQTVVVHPRLHDHLVITAIAAHRAIVAAGAGDTVPRRVDSYACRRIRGSSSWSKHARGMAVDIFRTPPGVVPPGGVWTPTAALHPAFVATFEAAGWTWGGRWRRRDAPHFEWPYWRAVPPPR